MCEVYNVLLHSFIQVKKIWRKGVCDVTANDGEVGRHNV